MMAVSEERKGGGEEGREDAVRCIIVTCVADDGTEDVLLTRFFDGSTPSQQVESEAQVWEATRHDLSCISEDEQQMVALIADSMVVFTRIADMRVYVVGCASADELVLSELLSSLIAVMRNLMPKGPSSGQVLLEYAKVHLALDDMVVAAGERPQAQGGFVDMLDPARLASMAALK